MDSEEATQQFIMYLKAQRFVVDYSHVATFTILFYDYLLTMRWELEMIWLRGWSYTNVLFVLTRYAPIASGFFILHHQLLLGVNPASCSPSFHASCWLVLVSITLAEAVMAIRTWAVWRCNIKIGILLVALQVCNIVIACFYAERTLKGFVFGPAPYIGFRGCFVIGSSDETYVNFISLTALEAVVLCLMVGSALRAYRLGHTDEFSNVVHRDAIHFYIILMTLAIANMVIIIHTPPSFHNLLPPLQGVLHSVFTSRIIINIRRAGDRNQKFMTDLHTFRQEDSQEPLPIFLVMRSSDPREECIPLNEIPRTSHAYSCA